jgi:hypothetical protein
LSGTQLHWLDDFRTSQETRVWASTASYRDSFLFLHVDDICTAEETSKSWDKKEKSKYISVTGRRGPQVSSSLHLRKETDKVSETLCFLVFGIPDDGQSPEAQ